MATYSSTNSFQRDFAGLDPRYQERFKALAKERFSPAIDAGPPYPADLRMIPMSGEDGIRELTVDRDIRATWEFGEPVHDGVPHVIWRRIGNHDVYRNP